jgi:hypothetical protein
MRKTNNYPCEKPSSVGFTRIGPRLNSPYEEVLIHVTCEAWCGYFIGLAYQVKDIVFRFIIEYNSSLRDFGP